MHENERKVNVKKIALSRTTIYKINELGIYFRNLLNDVVKTAV